MCGLAGVAVDGGAGDEDLFRLLGLVAGPHIVVGQILAQVSGQDRAVEGADGLDVQRGRLFQQGLNLRAVLAHDVQEVAAGLAGPIGVCIVFCHGAEAAEAVGGEEDLLGGLVADHDLRPVDHGGKNEGQGVGTQAQALAVLDHNAAVLGDGIGPEELLHIQERLGVAHHLHLGVEGGEAGHIRAVVRLHVADHQVIRLASGQCLGQVGKPGLRGTVVHRIQNGGLFVQNDIGIVAHAGGHRVLALEQVNGGIVHTHAQNGFADLFHAHSRHPLYPYCCAGKAAV